MTMRRRPDHEAETETEQQPNVITQHLDEPRQSKTISASSVRRTRPSEEPHQFSATMKISTRVSSAIKTRMRTRLRTPNEQQHRPSLTRFLCTKPRTSRLAASTQNIYLLRSLGLCTFTLLAIMALSVQRANSQDVVMESDESDMASADVLPESRRRIREQDELEDLASEAAAHTPPRATRQLGVNSEPLPQDESLQDDSGPMSQQQSYDYHANMPVITKRELANAIKQAQATVDRLLAIQAKQNRNQAGGETSFVSFDANKNLFDTADVNNELEAGWLASSMFHKPAPEDSSVMNQTRQALVSEEATRLLAKQYGLARHQTIRGLPLISVDQTPLGKQCPRSARTFSCIPGRYRSLSGHCNNVQQPDWGAALTALIRYAPARYSDNVARPLRAATRPLNLDQQGQLLPSARHVSQAVYEAAAQLSGGGYLENARGPAPAISQAHSHMTTMLSFFGQFVFHDLAFVPQSSKSIKCCGSSRGSQKAPAECMPIELNSTTENFCLDYVRSTPAARAGCNLGARDQLNLVSSFLDGSVIYGSSEAQMRQLRSFSGGRLRSQRPSGTGSVTARSSAAQQQPALELLPQIKWTMVDANETDPHWSAAARDCVRMAAMRSRQQQQAAAGFASPTSNQAVASSELDSPQAMMQQMNLKCFQAGDTRVNENIGLTLMHTIWMREHNLVADKLAALNRHWRDERLFEEARRIVVAELQQIAYNEFLPSVLGDEVVQRFNLTTQSHGYFQGYEPALNPGVSNELASAVFPFILATIPGALERYSERLEMLGSTSLADTFMDGSDLFKRNKFAQYLTGMISQSAMEPALGLFPLTMDQNSLVTNNLGGPATRRTGATTTTITHDATGDLSPSNGASVSMPQLDAVALTVQQGRDHGLKPYLYWRRACQLRPQVRTWQDLEQVMPPATVEKLRQVYASVEHLDLYLALLENPAPGATVGPTFVCLLARQFYQLKHGDRYWFENDLPGVAFTTGQLEELRQTSLAKVMCRNSQSSISFIQPSPLLASDPFLNAYQYCTNRAMSDLDVSKWRQPVNSAQQVADEQLADDLMARHQNFGSRQALSRGRRLIEENSKMIVESLERAKRQLDQVARQQTSRLRAAAEVRARRSANYDPGQHSHSQGAHGHGGAHQHAGYRYLPRLKRQALSLNNQSVIYELATNEMLRSLLRQGKDRERAQSVQADIRDFLYSLESIQLDNLLDNSAGNDNIEQFIANANSFLLTEEQRSRIAASGDGSPSSDPLTELLSSTSATSSQTSSSSSTRSSSVSMNCQDDDRFYPCDHTTPFRTMTGWCNNLLQPKFGQSFTLHDRILPNAYEDGLSKPRQLSVVVASQESGERLRLPSPRLISTTMHEDRSQLHVRYSLALMQFGQFGVDHDLTRTPFSVALDGSLLDCSACDSQRTLHRDCLPIEVPDNDAFYQSPKARSGSSSPTPLKKCLHFVRSLNGQPALGPRQQLNALTAYLDGSEIYGSDNCEARSLRALVGGRLNSSSYPTTGLQLNYQPREILPTTRLNPECETPSGLCFHAGDQRASEQPGLTAMHTIFLRLHNSIVDQLAQVNRHWNDEKLYLHGRRIVGAILQRITYGEFAPRLLGLDYMSKFDLILKQAGYVDANHYDENCSANILTEFASAAFRMGHSLIRNAFPLLNKQYKAQGKAFQLRTAFFNSQRILQEPQLIDSIMRGIVTTPIENLDNAVTEELTNHLFEKPREPHSGMDLISLNIQRARDHGVAAYNRYRQKCNLTRARTFEDLAGEIPAKLIRRLGNLYASVDDIDLFTGGLSELPVHGGIIGPTFGCIIGMQLIRLKRCDRFWHETSDPFVRFSSSQLAELRKMTLAKVICSQSDQIDSIQSQAMDVPDNYLNPRVPCSSLPSMDLGVWRENQKSCLVNKIKIELGQSKRVNPCRSCTCTLEGPVCRTAKINCLKMIQKNSRASGSNSLTSGLNPIMSDKSCLVQCAWALDMQPQ